MFTYERPDPSKPETMKNPGKASGKDAIINCTDQEILDAGLSLTIAGPDGTNINIREAMPNKRIEVHRLLSDAEFRAKVDEWNTEEEKRLKNEYTAIINSLAESKYPVNSEVVKILEHTRHLIDVSKFTSNDILTIAIIDFKNAAIVSIEAMDLATLEAFDVNSLVWPI